MTAWFDDEQLSAYLDGELTPQERRAVEERLSADPAARKLLAELRAQREMIQGLPRFSIPRDLSQSVVALAQHRRATGEGRMAESASTSSIRSVPGTVQALAKRLLRPRNLSWALLAASIAIVIALLSPEVARDTNPVEVARQDGGAQMQAERQTGPAVPQFRAAPSESAGDAPLAQSTAESLSMGVPQMVAPAAPVEAVDSSVSVDVVAQAPLARERKQQGAGESPQVIIERVVPMTGSQLAGARAGSASPPASTVAAFEIVCDVGESASLHSLVGRVIRRHQAIPDQATLDAAWEFAANREDVREKKESPPTDAGPGQVQPDVEVAFREQEGFEEAVIEFSATLAQVEAVLAELGAQPGQVRSISIPRELAGMIEESRQGTSDRIAAKIGHAEVPGMAGRRALRSPAGMLGPRAESFGVAPQGGAGAGGDQARGDELRQKEPGVGMGTRRQMTPATSTSQDLYRIRIVLRHQRNSPAIPPGGAESQVQPGQETAIPKSAESQE
jgi:anti-sigma factor RsiW